MNNTVWINLGCPAWELEFASYFLEIGCQVRFFRFPPGGIGRIIEIIAIHRLMLNRIIWPHYSTGKDLLLVSVQLPESLLLADSVADYMAGNSHREYYLTSQAHPVPLKSFFRPSVSVVLPADKPWEIARRWL